MNEYFKWIRITMVMNGIDLWVNHMHISMGYLVVIKPIDVFIHVFHGISSGKLTK